MKHLKVRALNRLKKALTERQRQLIDEIRDELEQSDSQHHKDLAGMVSDIGDASLANMLVDIDAAIIDRHVRELRDLEAADARIKDCSYGLCAECGDEIPAERLDAYPTAQRCVRCQEAREKAYAHELTPKL